MGLATPLLYLCSGVVLNVVSQLITDTRFSAPEAHIIPAVKFAATLVGAALRRPRVATATASQKRLMAAIGLLDASAYTVYCVGFFSLGATWSNLLLSGVGQLLTAALTRWVLRKRLTNGQLAGILLVGLGLAVRAAPAAYFDTAAAAASSSAAAGGAGGGLSPAQLTGAALVALAALLYSLLGVAYEKLLKGEQAPPSNAEIQWAVSILGFLASAAYQALYTVPNWEALVAKPMAASGASPRHVIALLALFGMLFNLHMLAQAAVFKAEGAIGVGLVNAVRGAVISLVVAALFCTPAKQHLCLTRPTLLSAIVTTLGGAVYVLAGRQRPPSPSHPAAKRGTGSAPEKPGQQQEQEQTRQGTAAAAKTAGKHKDA